MKITVKSISENRLNNGMKFSKLIGINLNFLLFDVNYSDTVKIDVFSPNFLRVLISISCDDIH